MHTDTGNPTDPQSCLSQESFESGLIHVSFRDSGNVNTSAMLKFFLAPEVVALQKKEEAHRFQQY